jgi:hypothetical protein
LRGQPAVRSRLVGKDVRPVRDEIERKVLGLLDEVGVEVY